MIVVTTVAICVGGFLVLERGLGGGSQSGSVSGATPTLRAGDVGFSLLTKSGHIWVYGDSWIDGRFIRNAITLNGSFIGEIKGVAKGHWIWPGAPFLLPDGRVAMYGAEMMQATPGMWGFQKVQGIRAVFSPTDATRATITQLGQGLIWSSGVSGDAAKPFVYTVDTAHRAHVGRPNANGTVTDMRTMGGSISGQYSVITDKQGRWWMVGQLPFLSRRLVAYPLGSRGGPVTGPYLPLATLPSPGATRFTYAGTIHPEINGLLTWAVNGSGPGTPYGLQRIDAFWPAALSAAIAIQKAPSPASARAVSARAILASLQGRINTQEEANRLEQEAQRREGWLAPPPTPLPPGTTVAPSSPVFWVAGKQPRTAPKGESALPPKRAGLKLRQGRQRPRVGQTRRR